MRRISALAAVLLIWAACDGALALDTPAPPPLPEPVTNNAVASVEIDGVPSLISLMGLGAGRTYRDIHARVWSWRKGDPAWTRLPDVPGPAGRLAGIALGVDETVLIFGGYTVAADGSEKSVALVQRLDPASGRYETLAPMPVPVDDTVALLWRDRRVYLVSGWHDHGNVNLVQVYDIQANRWSQATPFPGAPVFGHAGGIVGDTLVVCDGVRIRVHADRSRDFAAEAACYLGIIDDAAPARIDWRVLPHHGGPALYRMGAVGDAQRQQVIFAGGSDNPYNYDGIGYDGRPSAPSAGVFAYDLAASGWVRVGTLTRATMDHRGLVRSGDSFFIVGGMRDEQTVAADVVSFGPRADEAADAP